jgi:hypothetical protein
MIALLLVTLFQSAAPASAAAVPAAPPAKVAQAEKRVCRKETVVGSTIKKKICPRKVVEVARDDSAEEAQMAARDAAVAEAK